MPKIVQFWFAVVMNYVVSFGTPSVAAFILFAQEQESEASTGGILFYMIMGVVFAFLLVRFGGILKKMKIGPTKIFIRSGIWALIIKFLYDFIMYVDASAELLAYQVLAVALGLVVSLPFKLWAVNINQDLAERTGVLG